MSRSTFTAFLLAAVLALTSCAPMPFLSPETWATVQGPPGDDGSSPANPGDNPEDGIQIPGVIANDGLDDLAGLQAALDAAIAGGEPLVLPSGTYHLSGSLSISDTATITGSSTGVTTLIATDPSGQSLLSAPSVSSVVVEDIALVNLWLEFGPSSQTVSLVRMTWVVNTDIATDWLLKFHDSDSLVLSESAFLVSGAATGLSGCVYADGSTTLSIERNLFGADLSSTDPIVKFNQSSRLAVVETLTNSGLISTSQMDNIPNGIRVARDTVAFTTNARIVNNMFNGSFANDPAAPGTGYAVSCRAVNGAEIGGNYAAGFRGVASIPVQILAIAPHNVSLSNNHLGDGDIRITVTDYLEIRAASHVWVSGNVLVDGSIRYQDGSSNAASSVDQVVFSGNRFYSAGGGFALTNLTFPEDHSNDPLAVDLTNENTAPPAGPAPTTSSAVGVVATPATATIPLGASGYYDPLSYQVYE